MQENQSTSRQGTEGAGLPASRRGWPAGRDGPFLESGLGELCQVPMWYNELFHGELSSKDADLLTWPLVSGAHHGAGSAGATLPIPHSSESSLNTPKAAARPR